MRKFNYTSLNECQGKAYFECSMISSCRPIFDEFYSNYDVERILCAHGVVDDSCCDSETCALVVNFDSMVDARSFIDRLNGFLEDVVSGRVKI